MRQTRRFNTVLKRFAFVSAGMMLAAQANALEFSDVVKNFEEDTGRTSPLNMLGRYKDVVKQLSGMEVPGEVGISVRPRGEVVDTIYQEELSHTVGDQLHADEAWNYLFKRFQLIDEEAYLDKVILGDLMQDVHGVYLPTKREIILMEGVNSRSASTTLMHELVHAAQDRVVSIKDVIDRHSKTLDSYLAASALIEGQAQAVFVLARLSRYPGKNSNRERLRELLNQWSTSEYVSSRGYTGLRYFPYSTGMQFALRRYLEIKKDPFTRALKTIPISTEQVLHPEKFHTFEKPVRTRLEAIHNNFKVAGHELILSSTLGEYVTAEVFSATLNQNKNELKDNQSAAAGWGGDFLVVLRAGKKMALIWDTSWDTKKDAKEFVERYRAFVSKRFGKVASKADDEVVIKRKGRRVVVLEGNSILAERRKIFRTLGF